MLSGDLPADVVPSGESMQYPVGEKLSIFQCLLDQDCSIYPRAIKRRRGIGQGPMRLHNHHTKEMQDRRRNLISHLKPGLKGDSLPGEIWNGLRPGKWRRLHFDRPVYTILAQMHRDLSEWVHPGLERWTTVREAARLYPSGEGHG
jgi:DNA (cytosine-5)-methyltransferase 1